MRILNIFQTYAILGKDRQASKIKTISNHLRRRGHHVEILAVDYNKRFGSDSESVDGIRVNYVGSWVKVRNITLSLDAISFFRRRLRDFDVVHLYGVYDLLGVYLAPFARLYRVPYVVEPMGMFVPIVRNIAFKRAYHNLFGGLVAGGAAAIVATSPQEVVELQSQGVARERIVLRSNGLDLDEFKDLPRRGIFREEVGIPADAPLVLNFGRLARKKSLDLLTRAFARLPPSTHLALVGPDERDGSVEEVLRLSREHKMQHRVHISGPRFGRARLEMFVDADAFVLPSINENFGNVAAESIACGVPAIVTEHCGIAPLIEGRAGIVVPHEARELAAAMNTLLFDTDTWARLRGGCARITSDLSWDDRIIEMERLYARIS